MKFKKAMIWAGSLLILGAGFVLADEKPQTKAQNIVQEQVQSRFQVGPFFIDQDGDGICDFSRDHDNDGIPNSQDPDWTRPEDGTGFKNRHGNNPSDNQFKNKKGYRGGNTWSKSSFRQNRGNFGNGVCDQTGPNKKANRGGKS